MFKALKPEEMRVLRSSLSVFDNVKSPERLVSIKLLDEIVKSNFTLSFSELEKLLYGKKGNGANLKKRLQVLYNRALDILLLDINLHRPEANSEYCKARVGCKKMLAQAFMLRGRGVLTETKILYDAVIEKAKQFELYDELLEALHMKKSLKIIVSKHKEYEVIKKEIENYEAARQLYYRTLDYFDKLVINIEFKANEQNQSLLLDVIQDIDKDLKKIKSDNVRYFLYYMKIQYFQELNDYERAEIELVKLIDLLKSSTAIYVHFKYANALMNLGENYLRMENYEGCLEQTYKAEKYLNKLSYNYSLLKEIEFYAFFHSGQYDKALKVINEVLYTKPLTLDDFRKSKRNFYKACICFMKQSYEEALYILKFTDEIKDDKEGWNIGIRLLEILSYLELPVLNANIYKCIERLRKYISYASKTKLIRERDTMILKVILELERNDFDFLITYSKVGDIIEKFNQKRQPHSWLVKSSEMIDLGKWYVKKMKDQEFTTNIKQEMPAKQRKRTKRIKDNYFI